MPSWSSRQRARRVARLRPHGPVPRPAGPCEAWTPLAPPSATLGWVRASLTKRQACAGTPGSPSPCGSPSPRSCLSRRSRSPPADACRGSGGAILPNPRMARGARGARSSPGLSGPPPFARSLVVEGAWPPRERGPSSVGRFAGRSGAQVAPDRAPKPLSRATARTARTFAPWLRAGGSKIARTGPCRGTGRIASACPPAPPTRQRRHEAPGRPRVGKPQSAVARVGAGRAPAVRSAPRGPQGRDALPCRASHAIPTSPTAGARP